MSADVKADSEYARTLQEQFYNQELPDNENPQTALTESIVSGASVHDRDSENEDLPSHGDNDQAVEGKRKREKGKGRLNDTTEDDASDNPHAASRTSSAIDTSSDDNAALADAQSPDIGDTPTPEIQIRRQSRRQTEPLEQRKADEETRRIKHGKSEVPPSKLQKWWEDPKTGKKSVGYVSVASEPEKKTALPSDPEPSKRAPENAQSSATSKTQPGTEAGADQALDTPETQPPVGPTEDETSNNEVQDQDMSQQLERPSKIRDTDAADVLNKAFGRDDDSAGSGIPDYVFEQSFANHTNSATADESQDGEAEEDNDNLEDGIEARNPNDAHVYSKRQKTITKHRSGYRSTAGHGSRHGSHATSWTRTSANHGSNSDSRPTKTGEKRKSTSSA